MLPSLGKMSANKMFGCREDAPSSLEQIVTAFLSLGDAIATRWIETRKGVLLLQMVPDNSESGAIYIFDRHLEQWYWVTFDECECEFSSEKFDRAFTEYDLFRLVEQPSLLLTELHAASANQPPTVLSPQLRRNHHAYVVRSYSLHQPRDRQGPNDGLEIAAEVLTPVNRSLQPDRRHDLCGHGEGRRSAAICRRLEQPGGDGTQNRSISSPVAPVAPEI